MNAIWYKAGVFSGRAVIGVGFPDFVALGEQKDAFLIIFVDFLLINLSWYELYL
ncbi:MAG: hypothetical protein HQK89_10715 [Nitrospirae bacterium]|nr:hypothetical protein [Nitrospirota bacterium]